MRQPGPDVQTPQATALTTTGPHPAPARSTMHLTGGAGHDDLFEGPTWAAEIYPVVRGVIRSND